MPVTFGSVGDIIAVVSIVKDLIEALDKSRGSAAEYQSLIRDLRLLGEVLSKIEEFSSTYETNHELAALYEVARRLVEPCRQAIEAFGSRVRKYESTLGRDNGNVAKATFAKLRWQVGEKEEVSKFRVEVAGHVASMSLLLNNINW